MNRTTTDLVIGVDSSTTSTKAIAWDRSGAAVAQATGPLDLVALPGNCFEQDAPSWWDSLGVALRALFEKIDPARVAALAISNQRETMVPLDAEDRPLHRAMLWLDERGRPYFEPLAAQFGGGWLHETTGRHLDLTPTLPRFAWLRDREPGVFARAAMFTDVQGYLVRHLTGRFATSTASADSFGLFDMRSGGWSQTLLAGLALEQNRLPELARPGTLLGETHAAAAAATGLRLGTPIIAGGGDGQCAGLGTNCVTSGRAYLNLGTAIVAGVWSPTFAHDDHWRTLVSASGEGFVLESLQRSGALLTRWFRDTFFGTSPDTIYDELEAAASVLPIGSDGLLTLPYWSGCADPHWDPDARGCMVGITAAHGAAHVYRSILEALTLETARSARAMEAAGVAVKELVAIGGGAQSALWVQMVADATARPVRVCETVQASSLGAGMLAAVGGGWFATPHEAAQAMSGSTRTIEPDSQRSARYRELSDVQGELYLANSGMFARLAAFNAR